MPPPPPKRAKVGGTQSEEGRQKLYVGPGGEVGQLRELAGTEGGRPWRGNRGLSQLPRRDGAASVRIRGSFRQPQPLSSWCAQNALTKQPADALHFCFTYFVRKTDNDLRCQSPSNSSTESLQQEEIWGCNQRLTSSYKAVFHILKLAQILHSIYYIHFSFCLASTFFD